jgi:hypothetical protein
MTVSVTEHHDRNQVLVVVSGDTSMQDMMSFISTHRGGDQRGYAFVFDVSAATVTVSGEEMMHVAAYAADESRKAPMGAVAFVSSDPYAYGLGRMYQSYSAAEGRKNVGVFRTMAEAQNWLAHLKS